MFWQSVLDVPYRVLIYAVSAITMVASHEHNIYYFGYSMKFTSCIGSYILEYGSIVLVHRPYIVYW